MRFILFFDVLFDFNIHHIERGFLSADYRQHILYALAVFEINNVVAFSYYVLGIEIRLIEGFIKSIQSFL